MQRHKNPYDNKRSGDHGCREPEAVELCSTSDAIRHAMLPLSTGAMLNSRTAAHDLHINYFAVCLREPGDRLACQQSRDLAIQSRCVKGALHSAPDDAMTVNEHRRWDARHGIGD